MKIERIELWDFGPFPGANRIDLGTGLHVIVGPNGAGKSLLCNAIPYALYGTIPGTTAEQLVNDDGAGSMSVSVVLSDGTTIERGWDGTGKGRGWVRMSGVEDARAADAVREWVERSGMTAEDFRSTVFLGMGDMGALVTAGPAARRDQLGAWIVPSIWADLAAKAKARTEAIEGHVRGLQAALRGLAPEDPVELQTLLDDAKRRRDEAAAGLTTPEVIREAERQATTARAQYQMSARLRRLLDAEPPFPTGPEEPPPELDAERQKLARWAGELAKIERLVTGQFSGACPVDRVACPRADDIRGDLDRHRRRAVAGRKQVAELRQRIRGAEEDVNRSAREHQAHDRWWSEVEGFFDAPVPDVSVEALRRGRGEQPDLSGLDRAIGELESRIMLASRDAARVADIDETLAGLEPELIGWRWMVRACGRDGVPAMLLDAAIGTIADEGNRVLAEAGAGLRFEFRLRKQLKKLADRCRCGYVFPPRKRKCDDCGASRGQQVEHDCVPLVRGIADGKARSWRSSGQEAMLAIGLRLGAAAWRRHQIGCPWSTLILDEVEGSLSDENADAIREVIRSAPALGFEQQLMVSHRAASRLAGAHVIRVVREGDCSRLEQD